MQFDVNNKQLDFKVCDWLMLKDPQLLYRLPKRVILKIGLSGLYNGDKYWGVSI